MNLPTEIVERIMFLFGARPEIGFDGITSVDPERVVFVQKDTTSRVEGWLKALKKHPMSEDRNPWRKCHTENYWVWFLWNIDE